VFSTAVVPLVTILPAPYGVTTATLNGEVNPEGASLTKCYFEYCTSAAPYSQEVDCKTLWPTALGGLKSVSAEIKSLQPNTEYHFRLVAETSADIPSTSGPEHFTTLGPSIIDSASATSVNDTSAQLNAEIRPMDSDTSYHFEYDTSEYATPPSAGHGEPIPASDVSIGKGFADVSVSVQLKNLTAGTAYHYRVVAENARHEVVESTDHVFTTQTSGPEFSLPDGRAWELVSPPDKHQAVLWDPSVPNQASEDGSAIAYVANGPIVADPPGNEVAITAVLSTRGPKGWSSQDVATPHGTVTGDHFEARAGQEYKLFSSDLSLGVVEPWGETALPPLPESAERTFYERHADGGYEAVVRSANVTSGEKFANKLKFLSAAPDLAHVVLQSTVPLTATAIPGEGLYEWSAGRPPSEQLQLVSVLPESAGGTAASCAELGGRREDVLRRAISNDGSRVVWSSPPAPGCSGGLYLRDTVREETVPIAGGEATFQIASAGEPTRVFFTPTKAAGELHVCEVVEEAGKLKCKLPLPDLAPGVQGNVLGSSEDGSYVYFVAGGVLTAAHYNGAGWESRPVATLSAGDENDWGAHGGTLSGAKLDKQTARVSPDGRYVAFMSERSLTGYDNRDALSGERDEEVFLYDWQSNRRVCASCDPTGARPAGVEDSKEADGGAGLLVDRQGVWTGPNRWLAGLIPGWTHNGLAPALYQSRYLSDNGRLFFDSPDALVPRDGNGAWDVYQYEPAGVGGCTPSSTTYSPTSGGCVGLISSGSSGEESAFVDASATGGRDAEGHEGGGDVFFQTTAKLVSQDYDTAVDVYDAHECSAAAPCLPAAAVSPPPCVDTESCRLAPLPQPGIFGPSGSATFSGAGNVVSPAAKSLTRAQKLSRALRACRKKPKKKRAACKRQARKSYAARASGASSARTANASKRGRG
jgi:WD40-like Beta Propeller Repeat